MIALAEYIFRIFANVIPLRFIGIDDLSKFVQNTNISCWSAKKNYADNMVFNCFPLNILLLFIHYAEIRIKQTCQIDERKRFQRWQQIRAATIDDENKRFLYTIIIFIQPEMNVWYAMLMCRTMWPMWRSGWFSLSAGAKLGAFLHKSNVHIDTNKVSWCVCECWFEDAHLDTALSCVLTQTPMHAYFIYAYFWRHIIIW